MKQTKNSLLLVLLTLMMIGCDQMKPDTIAISKYPEIEKLLQNQMENLEGKSLKKEVMLEEDSEVQTLAMDTTLWKKELAFLEEINPNQPEYVGAFEESKAGQQIVLVLGEKERGVLKRFVMQSARDKALIKATIHEDKDVYVHHREVELQFRNEVLISYAIDGYQKIMLKDTVRFRIQGEVL